MPFVDCPVLLRWGKREVSVMHEQAMVEDAADILVDRWSVASYVTTTLGIAGIGAAIIFLALGHLWLAPLIALASWLVVLLPATSTNPHDRQNVSNADGSAESRYALAFGGSVALVFLGGCYIVKTWSLAYDADVVFSQMELRAAMWIILPMIQVVPLAYRVWRTAPPAELY